MGGGVSAEQIRRRAEDWAAYLAPATTVQESTALVGHQSTSFPPLPGSSRGSPPPLSRQGHCASVCGGEERRRGARPSAVSRVECVCGGGGLRGHCEAPQTALVRQ